MPRAMRPKSRSFTVVASSIGESGGRYVSTTPYGAARKAARGLFVEIREGHMQLQEITRGSAGRLYSYASIIEHTNKVVSFVDANGVKHDINRKYTVRVTKLTDEEYVTLGASPASAARHMVKQSHAEEDIGTSDDDEMSYDDARMRGGDPMYY